MAPLENLMPEWALGFLTPAVASAKVGRGSDKSAYALSGFVGQSVSLGLALAHPSETGGGPGWIRTTDLTLIRGAL